VPHSESVAVAVDRTVRRARLLIAAEAAALGAAVAAWSVAIGVAVAVLTALLRSRDAARSAVVRTMERADPQSRNLIATADEMASGALNAKLSIRERVEAEASAVVASINPNRLLPINRLAMLLLTAAVTWVLAAAFHQPLAPPASRLGSATPGAASASASGSAMRVTVRVEPPAYTHLAPAKAVDPSQIDAIEHALIRIAVETRGAVTVDTTGERHQLGTADGGAVEHTLTATRSGYVMVSNSSGARRMMVLSVKPDALPTVRLAAPGRDLVYSGGNPRIAFTAQAADDFGLRSLTLRYTKVSGSGEQFSFTDGEIPLTISRDNERAWQGSAARTLADLALAEGDMLIYRAVASDQRPGGGEASSDAFYIEVSKLGVAAGDAFTLPEQETRYALSQQMLIVKTDRLNQRRGSLNDVEFAEAAQSLAVEQRMIRSEFVFMLGGEIEDEEVEAEQSVEIQAGRLLNRGQRDIRAATVAMSLAEKLLTDADTAAALRAERTAVEALQRAFARDRYILRALASRSQLDFSRRLTGTATDALGWRRQLADAPANRIAIQLQSLVQGLGALSTREQLEVLAELAVRTDPESPALRSIAADLQKLADAWSGSDQLTRTRQLDAIALRAAAETRRVLADPPAPIGAAR
jgi:Domain of unknown function (DUF4175)